MSATAEYEIVSNNPSIQAEYVRLRETGVTHMLADMFACQRPPQAQDDTTWLAAQGNRISGAFLDDRPEIVQKAYTEPAKEAGVNIKGSVYLPELARYPGDPEAWVKNLGDVRARVEARGDGCDGAVKVKARNDVEPPPDVDIADDLVFDQMAEMMVDNPDLKPNEELYHSARDTIKPHWSKT